MYFYLPQNNFFSKIIKKKRIFHTHLYVSHALDIYPVRRHRVLTAKQLTRWRWTKNSWWNIHIHTVVAAAAAVFHRLVGCFGVRRSLLFLVPLFTNNIVEWSASGGPRSATWERIRKIFGRRGVCTDAPCFFWFVIIVKRGWTATTRLAGYSKKKVNKNWKQV